ncbi:helix-turn-helix domain-containing protein [Klebsiella oxytoca]|uniref:helix-turn-helix domain-containing protein n=1 Tax=Enterobacteriaceae TaxID=543 RepID=UPI000D00DAF9|nr:MULTISPECIES: helix-turn-helix transcriptional regulator [Enterobacteriaceae]AVL80624.1 XRE family transcriptional regulator [Klebsiella oxytoca]EKX5085106.1 helix-turn-helix transcriptional regulator [Klebsiella oxytoca]EKX5097249.1 helix-turn-helix transcriptional regulator [Klebsiella oxytoca]ELQ8985846.1 helix-turn-helix transcriptional regulator [Klebsiella oxytoca]MDM3320492.1 helix-turn-helix domain-containing protein [Citrobacter sp. Ce006]
MSSIYSDEYQLVIKLLRSARIDRRITQSQLAESLGKPQSFVAKVENGERRLDVIEFATIARLLSLDPAEILNAVMK